MKALRKKLKRERLVKRVSEKRRTPAQRHRLALSDLMHSGLGFYVPVYFRSYRPRWYWSKSLPRDWRYEINAKIHCDVPHLRYLGRLQEVVSYGRDEARWRQISRLLANGKDAKALVLMDQERVENALLS